MTTLPAEEDPAATKPAEELRAAARYLRNPYIGNLPEAFTGRGPLPDLLDAIADEMEQGEAVEGTASKAVHRTTLIGLSGPIPTWTTALATARAINRGGS